MIKKHPIQYILLAVIIVIIIFLFFSRSSISQSPIPNSETQVNIDDASRDLESIDIDQLDSELDNLNSNF